MHYRHSMYLHVLFYSLLFGANEPIKIEYKLLTHVDGIFVTADTIEMISQYYRGITGIWHGDGAQAECKVRYHIADQELTIYQAARLEEELIRQGMYEQYAAEFLEQLDFARLNFFKLSKRLAHTRGPKHLMAILMEASCKNRGHPDSILIIWSRASDADEDAVIDQNICTFRDLELFFNDLLNFLNDLVESCPKAKAHMVQRKTKWSKIKEILTEVITRLHKPVAKDEETAFMRYIKKQYIDKLHIDEITEQRIRHLFMEFMKHKSTT